MGRTREPEPPPDDPLAIDPERLAEEWLRTPQLTRRYAGLEADARHAAAQARARLDELAAQIRKGVRARPDLYDLPDKVGRGGLTESMIEAEVTLHPDYRRGLRELLEAEHDLATLKGDVTAAVDRRKALERLVELMALECRAEREPQAHSAAGRGRIDGERRRSVRGGVD